jgi:putative glutamine amidotransferase
MPVLGICRGMQVLNVAMGGTLLQDLPEIDGVHPHRRALGTFEGTEHAVTLEPGSLAAAAAGEEVHTARCHHHQAVGRLGDGLVVSGRAAVDGLAEAIEVEDGRWVLGVQWHPEADQRSRLFAALADAARNWSKGPDLTPTARSGISTPDTDQPNGG